MYFTMTRSNLCTRPVMNKDTLFTYKVSMAIFNFKVEDLNGFIKLKKAYALNGCRVPVFGVDNVVRCKIRRINPAFALNLERVCFGTLNDLSINIVTQKLFNVKKNQTVRNNGLEKLFFKNI